MKPLIGLAIALSIVVPATAQAGTKTCVETSAVVGETQCSNFGAFWSTERAFPLFAAIGGWSSVIQSSYDAKFVNKEGATVATTNSRLHGTLRAYGGEVRAGGYFTRYTYFALGFGLALGSNKGDTVESNGHQVSRQDGVNFIHARFAPVVGVRAPLGRLAFRLELATALQLVSVQFKAIGADGSEKAGSAGSAGFALEPRVAVDVWPTPDTTLSLWSGANLLRPGEMTFGLMIGGHIRAFDGT